MEVNKTDHFFTAHKIFWCLVYDLMLIGLFGCFIWFNVEVLGNDLKVSTPSAYAKNK